eukprot:Clim_evm7s7 gene=Clim_evmTU7s7
MLIKLILLYLVCAAMAQTLPSVKLGCAVFAPSSGSNPDGLVALFGAGMPYTVFRTNNPDTVPLGDGDRGLYSCIITVDGASVNDSENIRNYQANFGVRHVVMNSNVFGTASRTRSSSDSLSVPSNGNTDFLQDVVRRGSQWSRRNFNLDVFSSTGSVGSTIVRDGSGRVAAFADGDTLHIASRLNDYDLASLALQHVGLQFLLAGSGTDIPLQGHRRMLAGLQVDDVFAPPGHAPDRALTKQDMDWWVDWLAAFNAQHGSLIRPEMAFNGLGLKFEGTLPAHFGSYKGGAHDYSEAGTRKDFYDSLWDEDWWKDSSFWEPWLERTDPHSVLAAELRENNGWKDTFLWMSHTTTHARMGALGPNDIRVAELGYNIKIGEEVLGLADHKNWMPKGLITGGYSGLHNGELFVSMEALGMTSAISNSCDSVHSWSSWTRANYLPYFVNHETNGYDAKKALWIVPRHCTAVAWDAATFEQNLAYWSWETIEELMEAETNRHVAQLLALRHDPYMFHQANMIKQDYQNDKHALLSLWIEYVVGGASEYMTIPVISEGQDRIAELFNLRAGYAECDPHIYVQRAHGSTGAPNFIEITTDGECSIAFEGLNSVPQQTGGSSATVTNEGRYTWISVPGSGTVTFGTEVPIEVPTSSTQEPTATKDPEECLNEYTASHTGAACWFNTSDRSCAQCASPGTCQCGCKENPHEGAVCVPCGDTDLCEVEHRNFRECMGDTEVLKPLPCSAYDLSLTVQPESSATLPTAEVGNRKPARVPPSPPLRNRKPYECLNEFTLANTGARCEENQSSKECGQCTPGSCQCGGDAFGPLGGRVCVPCDLIDEVCDDHIFQFGNCAAIANLM